MNITLLDNNIALSTIRERLENINANLVGGAVIDILEGRTPKDYDFEFNYTLMTALNNKAKFEYISKTATTFNIDGLKIQVLNKNVNDFPFTIEKFKYNLKSKTLINTCEASFKSKKLIPSVLKKGMYSPSSEKELVVNALIRIPNWIKKGYTIDAVTYKTLVKMLANINDVSDES